MFYDLSEQEFAEQLEYIRNDFRQQPYAVQRIVCLPCSLGSSTNQAAERLGSVLLVNKIQTIPDLYINIQFLTTDYADYNSLLQWLGGIAVSIGKLVINGDHDDMGEAQLTQGVVATELLRAVASNGSCRTIGRLVLLEIAPSSLAQLLNANHICLEHLSWRSRKYCLPGCWSEEEISSLATAFHSCTTLRSLELAMTTEFLPCMTWIVGSLSSHVQELTIDFQHFNRLATDERSTTYEEAFRVALEQRLRQGHLQQLYLWYWDDREFIWHDFGHLKSLRLMSCEVHSTTGFVRAARHIESLLIFVSQSAAQSVERSMRSALLPVLPTLPRLQYVIARMSIPKSIVQRCMLRKVDVYGEGALTEVYPEIARRNDGLRRYAAASPPPPHLLPLALQKVAPCYHSATWTTRILLQFRN